MDIPVARALPGAGMLTPYWGRFGARDDSASPSPGLCTSPVVVVGTHIEIR